MWLGAGHLLQQVDIYDIPVLPSTVKVVQSPRDLAVILDKTDSQLSLCDILLPFVGWFLSAPTDTTSYSVTYF